MRSNPNDKDIDLLDILNKPKYKYKTEHRPFTEEEKDWMIEAYVASENFNRVQAHINYSHAIYEIEPYIHDMYGIR